MVIVVLNAILGFTQEYRAEKAMAALKKLAVPTVKVRREGQVREISARELVPGDIILLEAGNVIPADARLLESVNLHTQEAALTGESEPVEKNPALLKGENLPLGDRRNMVHMGTEVTYGRGLAVVTDTGMDTELGHIAEMIQTVEREPTPLQRRLEQLGRGLAVISLAIVTVVFVLGLLRGEDARLMFLTAISMAVAAIPEGLPAVVTIALALGAQRMLKRRALIRKLPAVETLGSVTVICSDKTGTLTENRMTVTVLDVLGETQSIDALLSKGIPVLDVDLAFLKQPHVRSLGLLVKAATLCNDAVLGKNTERRRLLPGYRRSYRRRAGRGCRPTGNAEAGARHTLAACRRNPLHLRAQAHDHHPPGQCSSQIRPMPPGEMHPSLHSAKEPWTACWTSPPTSGPTTGLSH